MRYKKLLLVFVTFLFVTVNWSPNLFGFNIDKISLDLFNHPTNYNNQAVQTYSNFKVGETYYLLADGVNIRTSANLKAGIVANLPIGTEVKILKMDQQTLTSDGYTVNWYHVSFTHSGENKTGYVWGGLISTRTLPDKKDKSILFHYGIESVEYFKKADYDKIKLQIRVSQFNKQLDKVVIKGVGGRSTFNLMEVFDNKGLKNIDSIIRINFSEDMSGGAFGDAYLFWDGKKLSHAITLTHGYDAPMFYEEKLIFPKEKGGQPNRIIWTARGGEYDDNGKAELRTNKKVIYKWNGKSLIKEK